MPKNLILLRGLPGAGKTSTAKLFDAAIISADNYFTKNKDNSFLDVLEEDYNFDASKLGAAHKWCLQRTKDLLSFDIDVAVANTFTTEKELKPYLELASDEVKVTVLVVENRHGNESVHNVPKHTIDKMRNRFTIKL